MVDKENELKTITATNLKILVQYLEPEDIINKITPLINSLSEDRNAYVRAALASSVLSIAPIIGKKNTNKHILLFFLKLLRDDDPQVRIKIFENFSELTKVLPATTLIMQIFPVYLDLSKDKNWRNRVVCLEILRMLEKELGVDFVNDRQILKLLMDRLSDKVYSVRMAAIKTLKNLSKKLGSSWADKKALPILNSFQ